MPMPRFAPAATPSALTVAMRRLPGLRAADEVTEAAVAGSNEPAGTCRGPKNAPPPQRAAARKAWQRGVNLANAQRHAEAEHALRRAVALAPDESLYWLNLANILRKQRAYADAIATSRTAFELDRTSLVACHLLAELLRTENRNTEALQVLRALDPATARDIRHHILEGSALIAQLEWKAAAMAFLQVLTMPTPETGHTDAYLQLGLCLANLTLYTEGAECFRTVTLMEPEQLGAAIYAAHYSAWACDWVRGPDDHARMVHSLALQAGRDHTPGFSPFCLLSMNDDAAMHRRAATLEAGRIERAIRHLAEQRTRWTLPDPGPAGYPAVLAAPRRRIGFVSADFRMHATSMLLVQVLEQLDRSRFEVVLYSHSVREASPLRSRLEAGVDAIVECGEMGLVEQAERIRADGVAILIDLSGYTLNTRLEIFALRPAPVQALWLAYPSTTGANFVDYVIGDPILTPLAHQDDFSERIAQLPVCYEPTDRERLHPPISTRAASGLPAQGFVYACFNQSYKINADVFSRWCRILHRVPGSVLWLLVPQDSIRDALWSAAEARGIDRARVIFAPFVGNDVHLSRLPLADVFLDTFPYGAHTTCNDALWMGLPVLTQVGRSFSSRVAASLLDAVGLPELAVSGAREYEEMAVRLAEDTQALAAVRRHLAEHRMALPLFDSARFTRELGALFDRMVDRWAAGLPPAQLPAVGAPAVTARNAHLHAPAPLPAPLPSPLPSPLPASADVVSTGAGVADAAAPPPAPKMPTDQGLVSLRPRLALAPMPLQRPR